MITVKDVEHVAKLARLALSEEEKSLFTKQLADIVKYVESLNELDTTNIEPMAHPVPNFNVMREDIVQKELSREEMLSISDFEEGGAIKVPRITD